MHETITLIKSGQTRKARDLLLESNVVDIAEFFDTLEGADLIVLFRILPKDVAADVFSYMDIDGQKYLVEKMSDEEIAGILKELYMDDAVDFIEELPANVVTKVLNNTTSERRNMINRLLSYPEDSAGSIMTTEYVDLKQNLTVLQAIQRIKKIGFDRETINTLYVINENRKLEGILEIRQLILSPPDAIIKDIMDTNYVYVQTTDDQEDVANMFIKYGYIAMPVVDKEHRLVGIVTVDDILSIIEEENEEDFAKMNALSPSDDTYMESSVFELAKKRIYWLLFLMVSATFTGIIIRRYENVLSKVVILASFIPMLMDTGGNAGSQASTLIIRGLALNELKTSDILKIVWKEFRIGCLVGVVLSLINLIRLYYIERVSFNICLSVCGSLFVVVIISKMLGGSLPILAKKLKFDPAIMAGPLITTMVDAFSLMIYFTLASEFVLKAR